MIKNDGINLCPSGCSARSPAFLNAKSPEPLIKIPINTPIAEIIRKPPKIG